MPLKKIRGAIAGAAVVCLSAALSFGVYAQSVHLDPLRVQAYTQPGDTPEEFLPTKRMAAAVIPAAQVNLGAWVAEKAAVPLGGALQVGAQRTSSTTATPQALGEMLPWQRSVNGGWVAAVSVTSENAYGLRLGVVVDQLPGSALVRVYTQRNRDAVFEIAGQRVLQILQANAAAGDVSSQFITGLMLAAPLTGADCRIVLRGPLASAGYVDITTMAMASLPNFCPREADAKSTSFKAFFICPKGREMRSTRDITANALKTSMAIWRFREWFYSRLQSGVFPSRWPGPLARPRLRESLPAQRGASGVSAHPRPPGRPARCLRLVSQVSNAHGFDDGPGK